jgi:hypothetical protein
MHQRLRPPIDFRTISQAALLSLPAILNRILPDGYREGHEWRARNPRRNDRHAGSFSINLSTGKWADFATGDKGGDVISLVAYVKDLSQYEAARGLSKMLGLEAGR